MKPIPLATLEADQRVAVIVHCKDPWTATKLAMTTTGRIISAMNDDEEQVVTLRLDRSIPCPEEWRITAIDWKLA